MIRVGPGETGLLRLCNGVAGEAGFRAVPGVGGPMKRKLGKMKAETITSFAPAQPGCSRGAGIDQSNAIR